MVARRIFSDSTCCKASFGLRTLHGGTVLPDLVVVVEEVLFEDKLFVIIVMSFPLSSWLLLLIYRMLLVRGVGSTGPSFGFFVRRLLGCDGVLLPVVRDEDGDGAFELDLVDFRLFF